MDDATRCCRAALYNVCVCVCVCVRVRVPLLRVSFFFLFLIITTKPKPILTILDPVSYLSSVSLLSCMSVGFVSLVLCSAVLGSLRITTRVCIGY